MTDEQLLANTGDATTRVLDNIFDSEYYILDNNDQLSGNFLLESPDFKSFGTGLTDLIISKGYEGKESDNEAKYKFFHAKCKENHVTLTSSVVKSWFTNKRPISSARSRENVFKICFALNCSLDETINFFTKVYFECPFNFRIWQEVIYYFCFKNSLGYDKAIEICNQAESLFENATPTSSESLFTHTKKIGYAVDAIQTSDDLLRYFESNKNEFLISNKTSYTYAKTLIKENTDLAKTIFDNEKVGQGFDMRKTDQDINIDLFLLILFDFDMYQENKEHSFAKESSFPEQISSNFISKENLSRIMTDKPVSYDTMRKCLMILEFFNYFANLKITSEDAGNTFFCFEDDFQAFLDEIGDLLDSCGYPPLYPRNPFDWLIMHCANTSDEPLKEFRNAIQAYYLDNE